MPVADMDANIRVLVNDHLCEVQVLTESFYALKGVQTPIYNLCRSLN